MASSPEKSILEKILPNYGVNLLVYALVIAFGLSFYYTDGTLILGGEGAYVLNFASHLKKFGMMWFPTYGSGVPNIAASGSGLNIFFLRGIEEIFQSSKIANFTLILLMYLLPFAAMLLVCRYHKCRPHTAFLISTFYILNPFSLSYLTCINQWNVFSLTAMPLFLFLILKTYGAKSHLFLAFGLASSALSFAFTNPPMIIILHIVGFLSLIWASFQIDNRVIWKKILTREALLAASFLLFNAWWLAGFLLAGASSIEKVYTASVAESWLKTSVQGHGAALAKMFALTPLVGTKPHYDFFSFWHSLIFAKLMVYIPITIAVHSVLFEKKDTKARAVFFSVLLTVLFFYKGASGIFGFLYALCFKYIPLFYVFKTPVEKFGLLYIFVLTIFLLYVFKNLSARRGVLLNAVFGVYLIFCSVPVLTGHIIPDLNIGVLGHATRKYPLRRSHAEIRALLNGDMTQHRLLSAPGVGNYQVCLKMDEKKYYTGLDPILMNTEKPFHASQSLIDELYEDFFEPRYFHLLGLYNIKKIVLNLDLVPWFGIIGPDAAAMKASLAARGLFGQRRENLYIYDLPPEAFRPLLYTAPAGPAAEKS